jgi:hypothetical protein
MESGYHQGSTLRELIGRVVNVQLHLTAQHTYCSKHPLSGVRRLPD